MLHLILARSELTAKALERSLQLMGSPKFEAGNPERIVIDSFDGTSWSRCEAYLQVNRAISRVIESYGYSPDGTLVILVDSVDPLGMSAIDESKPWDHLISLLILTFPEVRWIFGLVSGHSDEDFPLPEHSLAALVTKPSRDPIFDPTALREWVKKRTNLSLAEAPSESPDQEPNLPIQLPKRGLNHLAAVIDEEVEYAVLHAYTAYRYGYRSDVITTWALMEDRFGRKREKNEKSHGYRLILEDMRLAFPDKPPKLHLSRLGGGSEEETREKYCPLLSKKRDDSRWRILITTGQSGRDSELLSDNEDFLFAKNNGEGWIKFKPLGGICDVWTQSGLRTSGEHNESRRGNAEGFLWPPDESQDDNYDGHGAPGKLAMIARVLIERAEVARESAKSPVEWIRAALLASEAAELLNGKTPTLSLSALALKHECEVRAECHFVGAGYHCDLNVRFLEIKEEVASTCRWFEGNPRQAQLDASTMIINRIKLVFSEVGQMEEEEACLVKLRYLNRMMSVPKRWKRYTPFHWLSWALLFYAEFLLASFSRLLIMTALNLAFVFFVASDWGADGQIGSGVRESVGSFMGGGVTENLELLPLSVFAVMSGVFHLGILMSFLYSLVSRR